MERPDLDDCRYLGIGFPAAAGMVLLLLLRAAGRHPAALGIGLSVGAAVGLAWVLVLVVQLHMWKAADALYRERTKARSRPGRPFARNRNGKS